MKRINDESIDLIIADPPYFRILKNEIWDRFFSFEDYLKWSREYLVLCVSKLRLSGTLLLYGCGRNFSTLCNLNNILINNGMYFVQEIIINKGMKSVAGRTSNKIKMFPTTTENILVYRKDAKPFCKQLLKNKQKEMNISTTKINEYLGFAKNDGGNWTKYCGNTEFTLLPTKEHWEKIQNLFDINIDYRKIEEVYNGKLGLTNVWSDINFKIKNRIHPSEKPLFLSDRLIQVFSNERDLVYIPFAGSGSEIESCILNNRNYIGSEINKDYYEKIVCRISKYNKILLNKK